MKKKYLTIIMAMTFALTACNSTSDPKENKVTASSEVTTVSKEENSTNETRTEEVSTEKTLVQDTTKQIIVPIEKELNELAQVVVDSGAHTKEKYIGSFLVDVDLDGNKEAFAYYYKEDNLNGGSTDEYELWFIDNSKSSTKLTERCFMFDESEIEAVYSYQYEKDVMVILNWADSATSGAADIYLFRDGVLQSEEETPFGYYSHGYKRILENGDIEVTQDYYGFLLEWEEGQSREDAMMLGHAYIPYSFYYKDGQVCEYEAVEVDMDKEEFVWDTKPFEENEVSEIQVLRRENGEVDVNTATVDGSTVSFRAYIYNIGEDGKTLSFTEEFDGTIGKNMNDASFLDKHMRDN